MFTFLQSYSTPLLILVIRRHVMWRGGLFHLTIKMFLNLYFASRDSMVKNDSTHDIPIYLNGCIDITTLDFLLCHPNLPHHILYPRDQMLVWLDQHHKEGGQWTTSTIFGSLIASPMSLLMLNNVIINSFHISP